MNNFYITNDYKLKKTHGYESFWEFGDAIDAVYSANLGGTEYLLVASDAKLYSFLKTALDDNDNMGLNVKNFVGDGETTAFDLGLTNINSVQSILVDGEATTDYTVVTSTGIVTFNEAPAEDAKIKVTFFKYTLTPTLIGTIGTGPVSFFTFDKKVYILSGKYHSWDGTTLREVEGYTPLVFINTPPTGGGTLYEEINILSPKKHQTFNGDGTSKTFHLAQNNTILGANLASIDKVIVNGSVVSASNYTKDLGAGTVTFTTAPSSGIDNVDIYWTYNDGDRGIIEGMKFGTIFGGDVDTRVFLYGNSSMPNRTYYSGISYVNDVAVPSVEYFPATAFVDIGPSNFTLTDLTRQYDRLLATTNKPEAYYLTIGTEKLPVTLADNSQTTRYVPSVSTFPLNEAHGCVAMGQGQLIDNYPVTVDKNSLTLWKATNVRDEKNSENISDKINLDLNEMSLEQIKTLDFQYKNQMWFGHNTKIYIYNYFNKTFSRLRIPDVFTSYASLGNNIYMGLENGKIVKWSEEFRNFDGKIISAYWEMDFDNFGAAYLRKTMTRMWISLQPQQWSSAEVGYVSNLKQSVSKKRIEYKIQSLDEVDFSDFSFQVSYNPQPFRLKLKAKKFTNLKIVIDNNEETDCTILQLALRVESFGESK